MKSTVYIALLLLLTADCFSADDSEKIFGEFEFVSIPGYNDTSLSLTLKQDGTFLIHTSGTVTNLDGLEERYSTSEHGRWSKRDDKITLSCDCSHPFCFGKVFSNLSLGMEGGQMVLRQSVPSASENLVVFREITPNK